MTRLDGEKKSPLPYIIGLVVLALVAAGLYFFLVQNRGVDQATIAPGEVELQNTAPGGLGVDETANTTDANAMDANMTDTNAMDANAMDANAMDANAMDANAMDANAMDANSTMMDNSAMTNSVMDNSAMTDPAMSNSAMDNSAMSNSAMSNSAMSSNAGAGGSDSSEVVASRSKTIKQGDTTVTYTKKVLKDGSLQRDKSIAAEPVKDAKKNAQ